MKFTTALFLTTLIFFRAWTTTLAVDASPSATPSATPIITPIATPSASPTIPPLATPSGTATIGGQINPKPTEEPIKSPVPSPNPTPASEIPNEIVETIQNDSKNTTAAETPSLQSQMIKAIIPPGLQNFPNIFSKELYSSQTLSTPTTQIFLLSSAALIILGLTVLNTTY